MPLYARCPKCGAASAGADVCPACGLVTAEASLGARVRDSLFTVPEETSAVAVCARAAFLALLAVYGVRLAALDVPAGEFMHLLGGSLFQVGLPLVFGGILLVKNRDPFAAAVMLWWSGVELMDVAPYVYDAAKPELVLLTERTGDTGAHDFIDILGDLGLLRRAQAIGYGVHHVGVAVMGAALAWAAFVVWRQSDGRKI